MSSLHQELVHLFQVEGSRWSKDDGAVAGVDYPNPPAYWRALDVTMAKRERQEAWKAFNERPWSRSELAALREMAISRVKEEGKARTRAMAVCGVDTEIISTTTSDSGSIGTFFSEDVKEYPFEGLGSTVEPQRDHHSVMFITPTVSDRNIHRRGRDQFPPPTEYEGTRAIGRSCSYPIHSDEPTYYSRGLGVGASAFGLRGETDMDMVLRAVLRLSETLPKATPCSGGPAAVDGGLGSNHRRPQQFVAETKRDERRREIASKRQQSAPAKRYTHRDGLSKGNTPAVRRHQNRHSDPFGTAEGVATLDIRGRVVTSQGRVGSRLSRQFGRTHSPTGDGGVLSAASRFGRRNPGSSGVQCLGPLTDGSIQGLSESASVPDAFLGDRREAEVIPHTSLGGYPSSVPITTSSSSYSAMPSGTRSSSYSDSVSASHSLSGIIQPGTSLDSRASSRSSDPARGVGTRATPMSIRQAESSSGGSDSKSKLQRKDGSTPENPVTHQRPKAGIVPKKRSPTTTSRNQATQLPGSNASADKVASSGARQSSQALGTSPATRRRAPSRIIGGTMDALVKEANETRTATNFTIAHSNPTGVEKNTSSSMVPEGSVIICNNLSDDAPATMDRSSVAVVLQSGNTEKSEEKEQQTSVSAEKGPLEEPPPHKTLPNLNSSSRADARRPPTTGGGRKVRKTTGGHGSNTTSTTSTGNSDSVSSTKSKRGAKTANSHGNTKKLLDGSNGQESMGSLTSQESLAYNPQKKKSYGTKSSRNSTQRGIGTAASEANSIQEESRVLKAPRAMTRNVPAAAVKDPGESARADELPRLAQGQRAKKEDGGEERNMNGTPARAIGAFVATGEIASQWQQQ